MVCLPPQYVATKYPGYFWNVEDQKLYSLKISGVLKPLIRYYPNRWNHWWKYEGGKKGGYKISHKGSRRVMMVHTLEKLTTSNNFIPEEK